MPDKSIRDMTPEEFANWYYDVIDRCGIESLKRLAKEKEAKELAKRDWPPWPTTIYWTPGGTPAWHAQCAKRRRDWLERGSVPEIKRKED